MNMFAATGAGMDPLDGRLPEGHRIVRLIDVDPDLARGLDREHHDAACARSRVLVLRVEGPTWDPAGVSRAADPGWLGLFLVGGLMIREVSVGSRTACELFGPGDVIRPWDADGGYEQFPITVTWRVPRVVSLAVLDARFAHQIAGWPTIVSALMGRVATRARSLALGHAVSHLSRADARLLLLFCLLGERWGTVAHDGIRITLPLTHELLSMLIGVRRPTVTLALQRLAQTGLLVRERRNRWLLTKMACEHLHEFESLSFIDETGLGQDADPGLDANSVR